MNDSIYERKKLLEEGVFSRALAHFDKKILDLIRDDDTIADFEVLKQDIVMNHHRVSRIIDDRSKSYAHIGAFQDEKELLIDIFECYERDLAESKKTMLEKTGIKSFKFESVETELESVRNIKQRLKDEMEY